MSVCLSLSLSLSIFLSLSLSLWRARSEQIFYMSERLAYSSAISYGECSFVTLSIQTLQTSQDFSRILRNGKKSKMDKHTVLLSRLTYRKEGFAHQEPRCYKKAKIIRNIMGTIFLTVNCPAIRHLENVNKS